MLTEQIGTTRILFYFLNSPAVLNSHVNYYKTETNAVQTFSVN